MMVELGMSKECSKCHEYKPLADFSRHSSLPDGHQAWCKNCLCAAVKVWASKNRAKTLGYSAKWRAANREAMRVKDRASYRENIESARARVRDYWRRNPDKRAANARKDRARPQKKIHGRVSAAIRGSLSAVGRKGGSRVFDLLGYSRADLMRHLERQFKNGMTWDNAGEWHIDHIVPLSSFNITGPDSPEFHAAWALPNLRPLWATENQRKQAQRTHLL